MPANSASTLLYPFEPIVNINPTTVIGIYEEAWAGSFLARPGKASVFLIYKFDEQRVFKSEMSCDAQPRPLQIHHKVLPKSKYDLLKVVQKPMDMGWYYVEKKVDDKVAVQMEHLIGEATRTLDGNYVRVKRTGSENRFLPVKTPEDLDSTREEIEQLYPS